MGPRCPYDDGTTHLAFEPLVFLERLAALVPPPRSHVVLYHGVLSSHAAWRAEVIPLPEPTGENAPGALAAISAAPGGVGGSNNSLLGTAAADPDPADPQFTDAPELRARRLSWAQLLQRVFGLEILKCTRCGGRRKVVAFITRKVEVKRLCAHLGYPTEAPPIAPARPPPQPDLWDQRSTG